MTKEVQIAGGTAEVENFYIGPIRELRADTSNFELRLHDGVTEGGHRFLNRNANDARYQARNEELDQFKFPPQAKGFIVRVSPGIYRTRQLTSIDGDITFVNPRGTLGDIDLRLSTNITTDHTWSGIHVFSARIQADGGLDGDTFGVHTGASFGLHTGNLIGNAAGDHTGSFTGDLDTEGYDLNMGDESIEQAWIKGFSSALATRGVPLGGIIVWYGSAGSVPAGWFICDGSNGTPDLRHRFVLGAGPDHPAGQTGGSDSITVGATTGPAGAHTHTGTTDGHALTESQLPAHKHGNGVTDSGTDLFNHGTFVADPTTPDSIDNNSNNGNIEGYTTTVGEGLAHGHGFTTGGVTDHTHSIDSGAISNLPPFKALYYIMKGV